MSKTKQEIGEEVLRKVGALRRGQTALAYDLAIAVDKYEQVWEQLQAPELLADWLVGDEVPDNAVDAIVGIVAFQVRLEFAVTGERLQNLIAEGNPDNGTAYNRLRANNHVNWTGEEDPTEIEYF